jgi:hypothetical protein
MKKFLAVPLVALIAACSGSNSSSGLSLSARAGALNATTSSSATTTAPAATGISLSRIRIALRDLELRSRDDSRSARIALGPVVVDLAGTDLSSATVNKVLDAVVPAGTYDKIKLKIHRLQSADNVIGADELVKAGASMLIDGTFNGAPFQFRTALEAEEELEGKFVIDADSQNITVNFDPTAWFLSGTTALDPSDSRNQLAIEANIQKSLAAFQDDDESGHENHHGEAEAGDDNGQHDAGDDNGGGGQHGGGDDGAGHN